MGSFRLTTGKGHLHPSCNFAESLVETVIRSLCHSCGSELTWQGISLNMLLSISGRSSISTTFCISLCRSDYIISVSRVRRVVSEDSRNFGFDFRFISDMCCAILVTPSYVKWCLFSIREIISQNFLKSFFLCVFNSCCWKKGIIRSRSSWIDLTQ